MAVPTRFSRTTPRPERLAPRLGEHGPEILAEAGFSAVEIRELSEAGVCCGQQRFESRRRRARHLQTRNGMAQSANSIDELVRPSSIPDLMQCESDCA